jgi:hypothetical protein
MRIKLNGSAFLNPPFWNVLNLNEGLRPEDYPFKNSLTSQTKISLEFYVNCEIFENGLVLISTKNKI